MKFLVLFNLLVLLFSSYAMGSMSSIKEGATLTLEAKAGLYISETSTLINSGKLIAKGDSRIGTSGVIENSNFIDLMNMDKKSDINLILKGEGYIKIITPDNDGLIKSIKTIEDAFQTFSGDGESQFNPKVQDLQIDDSTTIKKESNLTLQVQKAKVSGDLILYGDILLGTESL